MVRVRVKVRGVTEVVSLMAVSLHGLLCISKCEGLFIVGLL